MINNDKTTKIKELATLKKESRQEEILTAIDKMEEEGLEITFYSVQKRTKASKSYLYRNLAISERIKTARRKNNTNEQSDGSLKAINAVLKLENAKLKKQIENQEKYRDKYEALLAEVEELKKQLSKAYAVW